MIDGDRPVTAPRSPSYDPDSSLRGTPLPDDVNAWVATRRWYGNQGQVPALRTIGHFALNTNDPDISIRIDLVIDTASANLTLYQLPTTERTSELPGGGTALIAVREPGSENARFIYDATYDPVFAAALLTFMEDNTGQFTAHSPDDPWRVSARGDDLRPAGAKELSTRVLSSRVLGGEQSNTSIIIDRSDSTGVLVTPLICKVFRILHAGENPDVTVQSALANAGSTRVPFSFGAVLAQWDDPAEPGHRAVGHLAFAQEFLPDAPDAWRTALVAATSHTDFTPAAFRLGQATADVHRDLALVLPTQEATPDVIAEYMATMRRRCRQAIAEVPQLVTHESDIETVFARAEATPWPTLQRIHGDYHLGQVLDTPNRGWVLLDFEGEPLRTLRERILPDLALRDVAGMLRSFSYVAGALGAAEPATAASSTVAAWATACRDAFLSGYTQRSGINLADQRPLLNALELDKALYEAVYERRNRPAWLPIPLEAIERLVGPA